jgi:phosphatidate cytidylyltransferase
LKPGFLPNLARRVGTAAVALPLLVLALFRGPLWLVPALVGAAVLIGLFELRALLVARGLRPFELAALAVAVAAFVDALRPALLHAPLWPLALVLALSALVRRSGDFSASVPALAASLLGAAYVGGLGGTLAALRTLLPADAGPWRLTLLFAIVMVADTCAYFVGSALGRHKLCPAISPGKTVEGGLGALVGGALAAALVCRLGLPAVPLVHALGLGVVVAAVGTVGDLVESLLKRWAGVKDSGALFPGHGGMLDRLDSLLFGAPVLYYYFLWW